MSIELLLLLLVLVLVAANALFVAAEFSFVTVDRASVERAASDGNRRAAGLLRGVQTLSTQMSGAQLGITVTSLAVGFIAEPSIGALLIGPLRALSISEAAALPLALTLAVILATAFQVIFGELVPKNWAIAQPLRVGKAVNGFQRGFTRIAGPLVRVLNGAANAILRLLGIEPREELASARDPRELLSLVARSGTFGTLDTATATLVARSIEFGDRTAEDVMTPRPRVVFVQGSDPVSAVIDAVAATGHARFPVAGANADEVIGMVNFKQVWGVPSDQRDSRRVREIMDAAMVVPESLELDPLLGVLRAAPLQMAVVIDEYGGTAGIVTLEDLVEEIVGEIQDEQDRPSHRVRRSPDGSWLLSGLLRPDEASEILGVQIPEGAQTETLGGFVTERLGRIAREGDTIIVRVPVLGPDEPIDLDVALTVQDMDGRRIDRIRARFVSAAGEES